MGACGRSMRVDDGSLDFVTLTERKWRTANGSRVREFTGILPVTTVGLKMGYVYEPRIEKFGTHWIPQL